MSATSAMHAVLGMGYALSLFGACAWTCYLAARRLVGDGAPTSTRACATALLALAGLVLAFDVLAALDAFRVWIAAPLWLASAVVAHRTLGGTAARMQLRRDVARAKQLLAPIGNGATGWLLVATGAIAAVLLLRGLVAPPLGWDALTYHFAKAGRWIHDGGFRFAAWPDAWGYYEYFPYGGDVVWAWAMLAQHGDGFLAPAGVLVWLSALLGAYGAARSLGAGERAAVQAALATAALPAVSRFITSGLVDNTLLAIFLLGLPFAVRVARGGVAADAFLLLLSCGLAASVKVTALPLVPLALGLVVFGARSNGRRLLAALAAGAVAAAIGAPGYALAWWHAGSPLHPVALAIGGREIFPGNAELAMILSRRPPDGASHWPNVAGAVLAWRGNPMGAGPLAPLGWLLGVIGIWRLVRVRETRVVGVFVIASAALVALPLLLDPAVWTGGWAGTSPRYLAPVFATLLVCGALVPGRRAELARLALIAGGLVLCLPRGIGAADRSALTELLAWLAPLGLLAAVLARSRWAHANRRAAALVALGLAIAGAIAWESVRARWRYPLYESAAQGATFDASQIRWVLSWPLWRALDDGTPHRLAVVAGWDGVGHNAFFYPLLGSRLQNAILYVPPTRDGAPLDYGLEADPWPRAATYAEWEQRLARRGVDAVVLLAPPPPVETAWVRAHPERFEPIACSARGESCAYRFVASE